MITVKYLRKVLGQFHDDDYICAYEGEKTGIIIRGKEISKFINARCTDENEEEKLESQIIKGYGESDQG